MTHFKWYGPARVARGRAGPERGANEQRTPAPGAYAFGSARLICFGILRPPPATASGVVPQREPGLRPLHSDAPNR